MDARAHVGPKERFEEIGSHQFEVLKEVYEIEKTDAVLDYGCGALRLGKHLIPYLRKGNYTGVDVDQDLLDHGLSVELNTKARAKKPTLVLGNPDSFSAPVELEGKKFDQIVLHSIINHAGLGQARELILSLKPLLKEDGIICATYLQGAEDWEGQCWDYPMAHTFTSETISTLCYSCGLTYTDARVDHPTGQTWFIATKDEDGEKERAAAQ